MEPVNPQQPYYVVGSKKLIIMSIMTLGFYNFYWCYKNWQVIKHNNSLALNPLIRAIFSPVFGFLMAAHFEQHPQSSSAKMPLPAFVVGLGYILSTALYGIFTFIFIGMMQDSATKLNQLNGHPESEHTEITHWVFSIVYIYLIVIAIELLSGGINL